MAKTEGFGERVRERLRAIGYWNRAKNTPDVIRFSVERGYVHSYIYRWLKGETPRALTLFKLADDLGVEPRWLLGEKPAGPRPPNGRKPRPIRGGSGEAGTLPVSQVPDKTRLIGSWLRDWFIFPTPVYCAG